MEEYITKDGKELRLGFTTGSCAAAAAKAAGIMLLSGKRKDNIKINTPKGIVIDVAVSNIEIGEGYAVCSIKKDAGDDPDVTDGADIFATVRKCAGCDITIDGGAGVGRVTKKGLDQPVGNAAINSVPRRMIKEALREVCDVFGYEGGLEVIVSVLGGEKIAEKTFNPRLGIVGGISILGTSGIVEPMSEQALVDTIGVELRQRKAGGAEYVLLTPGNYGADFIKIGMELDPKWAVLTSNFIGDAVDICARLGFKGALIVGHAGKLVKLAGNVFNTHSKYGDCRMEIIAANAAALGLSTARVEEILGCAMVDDAIRILKEEGLFQKTFERLAGRIEYNLAYRAGELKTGAILFSKEYGFLCETALAQELLKDIVKEQSKEN